MSSLVEDRYKTCERLFNVHSPIPSDETSKRELDRLETALEAELLECKAHEQRQRTGPMKHTPGELRSYRRDLRRWRQQAATQSDRNELLRDAAVVRQDGTNQEQQTAVQLMKYGARVQEQTLESLKHSSRVIADTRAIAEETVAKLAADTDHIVAIHDRVEEIDTTLVRTRKVISRIARRMANDKLLQCVLLLLFALAIAAIVVWRMGYIN